MVFYIFLYITNTSTHYASKKPAYMTELKFQRFWLVEVVTADGLYCEESPKKVINPYHMGTWTVNPLQHSIVSQN
jgi:hypothetical protein